MPAWALEEAYRNSRHLICLGFSGAGSFGLAAAVLPVTLP